MSAVHLTDAQFAQFNATGLIVVDDPESWRKLNDPCSTCNGFGSRYWPDYPSGATVSSCGVCGWDIEMQQNRWIHVDPDHYRRYHEGRDRPFRLDHTTYPQPCPDCAGGRQVVTVTLGRFLVAVRSLDDGHFEVAFEVAP
jgi:hypothetical protein